jgi:hypothetical protein
VVVGPLGRRRRSRVRACRRACARCSARHRRADPSPTQASAEDSGTWAVRGRDIGGTALVRALVVSGLAEGGKGHWRKACRVFVWPAKHRPWA